MRIELVTTLKRQATKILAELHDSKEPVLITEHGRPSMVSTFGHEAITYQQLAWMKKW